VIRICGEPGELAHVTVEGCDGAGRFEPEDRGAGILMWSAELHASPGGALRVHGLYDGCWAFAIGQTDEDNPLPRWPVTFTQTPDLPGSVTVTIAAPDGARLGDVRPHFG
jgi:hypothetical protein